ncbi:MAG TPA: preprotein translocase subunit YajC [Kofleriaceae bacterium]|nr:preprotein translocase subunit YajC [Kofleriaceae bacterium]
MAAQQILFLLLLFGVFYFIVIRPQMKRQKQHQAMLGALKKGDMIITRGGMVGKIAGLTDTVVTVELQEKVRVRLMRSHIDGKYEPKAQEPETGKTDKPGKDRAKAKDKTRSEPEDGSKAA